MTAKSETELKLMSLLETHNAVCIDFGISNECSLGFHPGSLHSPGQLSFYFLSVPGSTLALLTVFIFTSTLLSSLELNVL